MRRIGQLARRIPEPAGLRKTWTWLVGLALAIMLGGAFGELASDVWAGEGFAYDQTSMVAVHSLASPWLTAAMRVITTSASGLVAVGVALVLAVYWFGCPLPQRCSGLSGYRGYRLAGRLWHVPGDPGPIAELEEEQTCASW